MTSRPLRTVEFQLLIVGAWPTLENMTSCSQRVGSFLKNLFDLDGLSRGAPLRLISRTYKAKDPAIPSTRHLLVCGLPALVIN